MGVGDSIKTPIMMASLRYNYADQEKHIASLNKDGDRECGRCDCLCYKTDITLTSNLKLVPSISNYNKHEYKPFKFISF